LKKRIVKLLMVGLLSCMLVGCGNSTLMTADEAVSVSGKVSTAKTVEVEQLEETTIEYVALEGYLEENTSAFACYNIAIADENGNSVQPDSAVEVKIKLTDALIEANGDTYAVFYVNGENFTKLDCSEADGYVTFKANHFSVYVVTKYEAGISAIEELASGTETVIPHVHKYEVDETTAVEPTCIETGKEPDEICPCGDKIVGAEIASLGHNYEEVADSAVEATCDTNGKNADTKCSVCEDLVTGEVVPANGHQYGDYIYNSDATTSADGTETTTCSVCGGTETRTKAGTKIEITYVGYDEFGNGYTLDANGDKVFYVNNPYPINQIVDNGDWLYYYGVYGEPQKQLECSRTLEERYDVPGFGHWQLAESGEWILLKKYIYTETTRLGYYNGKMILYSRTWVEL